MGYGGCVQLKTDSGISFYSSCLDRKKHLSRIASFPSQELANQEF
ncbi:hypothetical protein DFP77_10233 [Marinomonas foliarum]|jgi:hypothetical protein|uniref:Uncharacterized protein n=1 Tax=Marinomonas foliarum TaxID=491950 RepID=A0A369AJ23_9GAMM|nr:hypothetical protein DFP77_10233 [Marinomonas foliarum]